MSNNRMTPGPINNNFGAMTEAVCVHTRKVYDSCKDKDCLQDLRVYPTRRSQQILENAINVKPKTAELIWTYIDVEAVPFNKGFYTVDVRYFYKVTADAFCGAGRPKEICGIASYDKKTVLFGSEGNVKIFSSMYEEGNDRQIREKSNLPIAVVEVVDPVVLDIKMAEQCNCSDYDSCDFPQCVSETFDDELFIGNDGRRLYVTLGQFSIIRIERDIQLLMPAYDICLPSKECSGVNMDDPCELFERFNFPVEEFFPPRRADFMDSDNIDINSEKRNRNGY